MVAYLIYLMVGSDTKERKMSSEVGHNFLLIKGIGPEGNTSDFLVRCVRYLFFYYLLTAIGLSPGGSSTVHIYTQTIHRTIQNKQYIEQHNNFGRVRAVPRLG